MKSSSTSVDLKAAFHPRRHETPVMWGGEPLPYWAGPLADVFNATAKMAIHLRECGAQIVMANITPSESRSSNFDIQLVFELRGTTTTIEGTFSPTSIMVDYEIEPYHPRIGDPIPAPKPESFPAPQDDTLSGGVLLASP
jgi:hypothetical protein